MGGIIGSVAALFGNSGPSQAELSLNAQTADFSNELMQDYRTLFGERQDIMNQLRQANTSTISAGPNQHGYSSDVLNALHTQLINSNAAGYRNAVQAARNFISGQGGGATSGYTSGIAAQIEGDIAAQASNKLTEGQTALTVKDYDVGRQNYWNALTSQTSLAGMIHPEATGQLASSELGAALTSQRKVDAEKQAAEAQKWGAIGNLAGTALTMGLGGIGALGSGESFGEGFKDFLSGAAGGTGSPAPNPVGFGQDEGQ